MKNFKTIIKEVSSQKAAKDFEDYIWQLAVLSGGKETKIEKLEKVLGENKEKFPNMTKKQKTDTLAAVSHLNKFFNEKWKDGYNANFAKIGSPEYGTKSAKADIVLVGKKKYGISVKMSGSYVVVSAQNKSEFEGIFYSALDYFEKKHSAKWDLSEYKEDIENIKKEIKHIKNNVIGKTLTRNLKPEHFDSLKQEEEFSKHKEFLKDLKTNIIEQNKKVNDDYADLMKSVVKSSQKRIRALIENSIELRSYIVWEALTASLKYKHNLPAAEYIISPTGCYDIRKPESKFVESIAETSTIGIRGMVHGKMRSGRGKAVQKYLDKSTMNWNDIYDDLNKMDMSLKWDMPASAFKTLAVDEGILSDIWNKVKDIWNSIKERIINAITNAMSISNNILDKLTELKKASFFDLIKSNDIEFTGKIEIK
tara:strand:+ start:193 stop:1461 length:1269 start_codon:yes stop_codon:yes gene_type:complete